MRIPVMTSARRRSLEVASALESTRKLGAYDLCHRHLRLLLVGAIAAGCSAESPGLVPDVAGRSPDAPVVDATLAPTILWMAPEDLHNGDELFIYGKNFGDLSRTLVTFDGVSSVTTFIDGSNDTLLILRIPTVSLLHSPSRDVPVNVSTPHGSASGRITLRQVPITIPGGELAVGLEAFPAGTITPGHDYVFGFRIEAATNLDETFDLEPTVPPGWRAVMVSDASGATELPTPAQIAIAEPPPGQSTTMAHTFVRVTVPANATAADAFVKLDVTSVHNGSLLGTSGRVDVPFNVPSPPGQTVLVTITSTTGPVVEVRDNFLFEVPTTTSVPIDGIDVTVWDLKAISYTLSLSWKDTANDNRGWTASWGGAPGMTSGWPHRQKTISLGSPGSDSEKVALIGAAGATENTLVITVRSTLEPDTDYAIFNLNVVPLPP
jgi:hypothetical protein